MALEDSNSNGKKMFENTYYSRVRFKDYESKKILGFNYKSGMLIIDISKEKDGFSYESVINIYITPTKAKLLLNAIAQFNEAYATGKLKPEQGFGINAGMGEISSILALHVDENNHRCITIGKIDANGSFTKSESYTFSIDFHYGLQWKNINEMDVEKVMDNDLEYNQFCEIISSYASSSNGAIAYSVADLTRYDTRGLLNKMNPIYDKLGIEHGNGGKSNYSGNNYFNGNNRQGTSQHKQFNQIEDSEFDPDTDDGE